eukprot:1529267-Pleurochrysis_carterae.AAC.2
MTRRREQQRQGGLPAGDAQVNPRYLQVYIDDFAGVSLDDEVRPPACVAGASIDPRHAQAAGRVPAPANTRAHVLAQLGVLGMAELGLHAALAKIVVGDPVTALGMSVGREVGRLRCPDGKRELMLATLAEMRTALADDGRVQWRQAHSLVGRLANIAQVLPKLKLALRGGYAVARPAGEAPAADGAGRTSDCSCGAEGGRRWTGRRHWTSPPPCLPTTTASHWYRNARLRASTPQALR